VVLTGFPKKLMTGLLIVHVLLFGVFWLGSKLLAGDLFTLIGLSIVVADALLILGVWRNRTWTRPLILVLAPPLAIYLCWLLIVNVTTPPIPIGFRPLGDLSVFELLRVLLPAVMLLTTSAVLVVALVAQPQPVSATR
jgi:hypothetical protein